MLISALWLMAGATAHAQQNDYAVCTALRYDRVRTETEIAGTIGACSRILEDRSASAEQRAHAYYFRGLNHFLDATRLSVAAMKPIGSAGEAAQHDIKSAFDDLAAAIATTPQPMPQPFSLRATIETVLERYDDALSDLEQAIHADPKVSSHFVQRALIHERLDRFKEARSDLDAALALNPADQNALIQRAKLWTRYGDLDRAFADYDLAEKSGGSQTWRALSGRAVLDTRLGDPVRAFADWTRAGELSPLPTLAAQFHVRAGNLARDYLKDFDKAQQAYGRALAASPVHAEAVIQRGLAFERMNRFDDAASEYRKAADMTRGSPLEKSIYDYSLFRLDALQSRAARKAGDPLLPANIAVLSRSAGANANDGRRIALVIGNAAYTHVAPLMNSDRDAESVGAALSEAGFAKVTVAINLERAQMEALLRQFAGEAAAADWALIYYAGHGIEVGGINYAIPTDASLDTLRNTPSLAISIDQFVSAAGPAKDLRLIVLDACRDDPFVQEAHRTSARRAGADKPPAGNSIDSILTQRKDIGGGLARMQPGQLNTVALFSTQPGQVTLDGDELNSPFTRAFVTNVPVPNLDLRRFFERVRDDVANGTQGRQRPAFNGQLREGERFILLPTP